MMTALKPFGCQVNQSEVKNKIFERYGCTTSIRERRYLIVNTIVKNRQKNIQGLSWLHIMFKVVIMHVCL